MNSLPRKIPLTINPSFWILATLISWLSSNTPWQFVSWLCVVFASVLVHELGHALLAKMWGQNVQIVLGPLGGATIYGSGRAPLSRLKEFTVVSAGPSFGFLLAGACYLFMTNIKVIPEVGYFLFCMVYANIFWSFFNLLPVHPFDGGKLMSILFEAVFGLQGMRFSYLLSGVFAIFLTAGCMYLGQVFAAALLLLCAFESFRSYKERRYFQTTATEKQADELEVIEQEWQQNRPELAIEHLEQLVKKTKEGDVHTQAQQKLAEYLAATGKTQKAYSILRQQKSIEGESLKLLQLLCYKLGLWQESLDAGARVFRESQDPSCAIMNAFTCSHLGDVQAAVNWLGTVKKTKAVDMLAVLAAADFDSIRSTGAFQQFVQDL